MMVMEHKLAEQGRSVEPTPVKLSDIPPQPDAESPPL